MSEEESGQRPGRLADDLIAAMGWVYPANATREALTALRDTIGTGEYARARERVGLSDSDSIAYARRTTLAVMAVLQMLRMEGRMDPVSLALNAAAIGYERGVRDATDMEISPEGMRTIADKVDREEENGREVERFRRELEGL